MSSYPRYSSSYRVTRESSGPGGVNYYSSSYATPSLYTPGRTYHSSYMVPSVKTHSYSVPTRSSYTSYRPSYSSYVPRWLPANPYLPAEIWADDFNITDPSFFSSCPAPIYRRPPRRPLSMPPEYKPGGDRLSTLLTPSTQRKIQELHDDCSDALLSPSLFERQPNRTLGTETHRTVPSSPSSNPVRVEKSRARNPALPEWRPRHQSSTLSSCDLNPVRLNIAIMSYFDRAKELADYDSKRTVNMLDESTNTRRTADLSIDRTDAAQSSAREDFFSTQSVLAENLQPQKEQQSEKDEEFISECEIEDEKNEERDVKDEDMTQVNDVISANDDVSQLASVADSEIDGCVMNETSARNSPVNDTDGPYEAAPMVEAEVPQAIYGQDEYDVDASESPNEVNIQENGEEEITAKENPDEEANTGVGLKFKSCGIPDCQCLLDLSDLDLTCPENAEIETAEENQTLQAGEDEIGVDFVNEEDAEETSRSCARSPLNESDVPEMSPSPENFIQDFDNDEPIQ